MAQPHTAQSDDAADAVNDTPVTLAGPLNVEGCRYIVDFLIPRRFADGKMEFIDPIRNPGLDTIVPCLQHGVCLKANPIDDRGRRVDMLNPRLTTFLNRLADKGMGVKRVFASIEWQFDQHPWLPEGEREILEREDAEYPALKAEMEAQGAQCLQEEQKRAEVQRRDGGGGA